MTLVNDKKCKISKNFRAAWKKEPTKKTPDHKSYKIFPDSSQVSGRCSQGVSGPHFLHYILVVHLNIAMV